jgi:hypothetical protein
MVSLIKLWRNGSKLGNAITIHTLKKSGHPTIVWKWRQTRVFSMFCGNLIGYHFFKGFRCACRTSPSSLFAWYQTFTKSLKDSYIIVVTGIFQKDRRLHLADLHGFGECTMKALHASPFPRALPNTKEIFSKLLHFSSPKSFTGMMEKIHTFWEIDNHRSVQILRNGLLYTDNTENPEACGVCIQQMCRACPGPLR